MIETLSMERMDGMAELEKIHLIASGQKMYNNSIARRSGFSLSKSPSGEDI